MRRGVQNLATCSRWQLAPSYPDTVLSLNTVPAEGLGAGRPLPPLHLRNSTAVPRLLPCPMVK